MRLYNGGAKHCYYKTHSQPKRPEIAANTARNISACNVTDSDDCLCWAVRRVLQQVPMDQPEVALAMLNAFVHEDARPFEQPQHAGDASVWVS